MSGSVGGPINCNIPIGGILIEFIACVARWFDIIPTNDTRADVHFSNNPLQHTGVLKLSFNNMVS